MSRVAKVLSEDPRVVADEQFIPLGAALDETGFGKKAWSKLLEAHLVRPARRVAGNKMYALESDQVARLRTIAALRNQLGKRFTFSAVAFALASSGDQSVPIELVKDHLRSTIVHVQGRIRRLGRRHFNLNSNPALVTQHDVNVTAKKIARRFTKDHPRKDSTYEFLLVYAAMVLRMMYLGQGVDDYADNLERLMTPFVRVHHPLKGLVGMPLTAIRENAGKLASMISDIRGSLRLDDQNIFFAQLERIPDAVFWKFFEMSPRLADVMLNAYQDIATVIAIPEYGPKEREWFRIAILLMLVAHYDDANPTDTYRELLARSTVTVEHSLRQLAGIVKMSAQIPKLLQSVMRK